MPGAQDFPPQLGRIGDQKEPWFHVLLFFKWISSLPESLAHSSTTQPLPYFWCGSPVTSQAGSPGEHGGVAIPASLPDTGSHGGSCLLDNQHGPVSGRFLPLLLLLYLLLPEQGLRPNVQGGAYPFPCMGSCSSSHLTAPMPLSWAHQWQYPDAAATLPDPVQASLED